MIAGLWIMVSISPYMLHPLTFEHATRYLLIPMAGFSLLFGALCAALFEVIKRYNPKAVLFLIVALGYAGLLNVNGNVFHFKRYQQYLIEHTEADCSPDVYLMRWQIRGHQK